MSETDARDKTIRRPACFRERVRLGDVAIHYLLGALVLAFTLVVYSPGLDGGFEFDDYVNIVDNSSLHITEVSVDSLLRAVDSGTAGPTKRPISMLSFALNHYFFGSSPYFFKLINIVIHLINGVLVFILARLLLRSPALDKLSQHGRLIALVVASAWLLHPVNLTSVLYVVQRMASLSSLFTLLALIGYVYARMRSMSVPLRAGFAPIALLVAFTSLAVLAKESGILALAYAFVIEICLLKFTAESKIERQVIVLFHVLLAAGGLVAGVMLMTLGGEWLSSIYESREFTLEQRLLTEARALWFYSHLLFLPSPLEFALYHDDFAISNSLTDPQTTWLALVGLLLLFAGAIYAIRSKPLLGFAILWFFAGHALESTVLPLELVHEHRNYLASFGLLFLAVCFVYSLSSKFLSKRVWSLIIVGSLFLLGFQTFVRAQQWGNPVIQAVMEARHHPDSYRANYALGRVYVIYNEDKDPKYYQLATEHFLKASEIASFRQKALFGAIQTAFVAGEELDRGLIELLRERLASEPFQPPEVIDFQAFTDCLIKKLCVIEDETVRTLFDSALSNPTLHSTTRARLWNIYGIYMAQAAKDYDGSLDCFELAKNHDPKELQYQLNLIELYIFKKMWPEGRAQLEETMRLDRWRLHADELLRFQTMIESGRGSSPQNG